MYLLINLSKKDSIIFSLFDEKNIKKGNFQGKNKDLLVSLGTFFSESGIEKKDVKGIMVLVGSGGFTSTRLAVTVANTFAYVLTIPILGIKEEQIEDIQTLIPELLKQTPGNYISATYSGEANIGKTKK